ncbi:hypothetical protein [Cohnella mopanensis]|uniref:hypothetical protein n=1 Tax=Cohnella mopanensis TaxID=2911966 RepID=UPI001EF82381|nr:hypothetical protein [Cohnella mopanensis]
MAEMPWGKVEWAEVVFFQIYSQEGKGITMRNSKQPHYQPIEHEINRDYNADLYDFLLPHNSLGSRYTKQRSGSQRVRRSLSSLTG